MAFPISVVDQAWDRSGGQCECIRKEHEHKGGRCNQELFKVAQGKETPLGWEANHKSAGGPDTVSNCEILCQDCHKRTRTYGG